MSGAPWTSSLNGVLNLLIISFLVLRTKYSNISYSELADRFLEFNGKVEGDDGIFVCDKDINEKLISSLGVNLKIKYAENYTKLSFCGIAKPSLESSTIVTDPLKVLCKMFVVPPRYYHQRESKQSGIIRASAMSMLYLYRDLPIVSVLAAAVLKRTCGTQEIFDNDWYSQKMREEVQVAKKNGFQRTDPALVQSAIPAENRDYVSEHYDFDVAFQLQFEQACIDWSNGQSVEFPANERIHVCLLRNAENRMSSNKEYLGFRQWHGVMPDPRSMFLDSKGSLKQCSIRPKDGTEHEVIRRPPHEIKLHRSTL